MKTTIFLFFTLYSLTSLCQTGDKKNSIYYLIDTTRTPIKDRMWDIHTEYPSIKTYNIKCPCLQYDSEPMFIYNIAQAESIIITKTTLKTIKLISLPELILYAKTYANPDLREAYEFYFIEPNGKKYIIHKVRLIKPKISKTTN